MPKIKIPVFGTIGKSINIDPSATSGATVGVDLLNADGSLVVLETANQALLDRIIILEGQIITAAIIDVANLAVIQTDLGAIIAGTITLNASGHIKSGQTAYDTGTGFWLGLDGGTAKFSIGDGSANRMTWNGTTLTVRGDVSIGSYVVNTGNVLLAANTERSSTNLSFVEVKKFEINKPGTLNVFFDGKMNSVVGGVVTAARIRVKLDGVQQGSTQSFSTSSFNNRTVQFNTTETSQFITIEYAAGVRNTGDPVTTAVHIQNAQVRADIEFGEAVITD